MKLDELIRPEYEDEIAEAWADAMQEIGFDVRGGATFVRFARMIALEAARAAFEKAAEISASCGVEGADAADEIRELAKELK